MATVSKWTWLLAVLAVLLAGSVKASQPPLPIDEYWRLLEDTRFLVGRLANESPEAVSTQLDAAAAAWETITAVSLPNGSVVPVDHGSLAAQLRADPPDLKKIGDLLTAIGSARDTWPPPGHTADDLRALDKILSRPEFQWPAAQPSPLEQLWLKLQEAFWRFISRLLPREAAAVLGGDLLGYSATALAMLAMVLILAYVARSLLISFAPEAVAAPEGGHANELLTADAALRRAQAFSGSGDYRSAVRYLYLSALLLLDEQGLLRYDRSLTNREYLRSVAHLPEVAAELREVVEVFDRVWYGYQPLDAAGYARYAACVAELRRQR